jgi:predicted anti-sigma-YlaC factor YlaD
MDCREFERMIVDYVTKELKGPDVKNLEEHLKTCNKCRKTLEEYRNLLGKMRELQAPVYGEEFWEARLKEIKNCQPRRQKRFFLKPAVLSTCTLLVIISLFTFFIHNRGKGTKHPVVSRNGYETVLSELPYTEETLMDMIEYIDDDSASKLLNIIFENNSLSVHIR